ncbi:MAG: ribose 1,5-bisphosphokinase [Zoogloeaceae bacterium]|jgi:ribose 1,5-bisphosphokinase|nr:ribose 1,5-bisphosphokinase [Zoogloeaceae bacterium]
MRNGALIYLIGPSGVGKDSLLTALRQIHVAGTENLLIARRYITRPLNPQDAEQHIPLHEEEFRMRQQYGLFALDWRAHGYAYAVGVEIDAWMEKGFFVIVNGSRQYLPEARQKYAGQLHPVCLTVSADTLRKRLVARGRENAEQIERRMQRALKYQDGLPGDCLYLHNEGDILDMTLNFLRLLRDIALRRRAHPFPAAHTLPKALWEGHPL